MATFPHIKLTAFGTLGADPGVEIWSCTTKVVVSSGGDGGPPLAPTAADLTEVGSIAANRWSFFTGYATTFGSSGNPSAMLTNDVHFAGLKASAIAASGRDDPGIGSQLFDSPAYVMGGAGPQGIVPYSVALKVTFRGATYLRGTASVGGFYLPVPNILYGSGGSPSSLVDGAMTVDATTNFAKNVARYLVDPINALTALPTSGRRAIVANISKSTAAGGLRWQKVTSVSVDNRPDTIRRRSNKLGSQGVIRQAVPYTG